jgi:hypothetical protein
MDPDNTASKYSLQCAIFKDGFLDDSIKWLMENLKTLKELSDKNSVFFILGGGWIKKNPNSLMMKS